MIEMEYTGERMTSSYNSYGSIEHLHRYAIIQSLLNSNMVVADIACGEGYGTNYISNFVNKVIGVDISYDAISHARAKYTKKNIEFLQASAIKVPLEDNSVDLIVSFETIEHLESHYEMLKEFKRILKHEGILVISTPDKSKYSIGKQNLYHVKELSYYEFKELLKKYFSNVNFYWQKTVHGSLIYSHDSFDQITLYQGNFNEISYETPMDDYEFIIALACNNSIEQIRTSISIFDAGKIFNRDNLDNLGLREKYFDLVASKKFKIINKILKLFRLNFKL